MDINQAANILEVSTNINKDDLKLKFKRLVMKYHPDRNQDKDTTQKFIQIKEAYDVLFEHAVLLPVPTINYESPDFWHDNFVFVNQYVRGSNAGTFSFTFSSS